MLFLADLSMKDTIYNLSAVLTHSNLSWSIYRE
jgi:hypothetical protein